jgi:hypothetical protein
MYRVLQGKNGKVADATFVAGAAMKRGMLVVKGTDGEVNFPASATDKNVYFVGKEFTATGVNGDRDLSDYTAVFEDIAEGEGVVTEHPESSERYFTDQVTGTFTVGGYAIVGTDGLLVASTTATRFQITATDAKDAGSHTGVAFSVLD